MEIVYSFIGCFLALILNDFIEDLFGKKNKQNSEPVVKREIPKNIGRFSDPLGEYEQYKDKNRLYKSYVPERNTRRSE